MKGMKYKILNERLFYKCIPKYLTISLRLKEKMFCPDVLK